jgi:hypothetical protein
MSDSISPPGAGVASPSGAVIVSPSGAGVASPVGRGHLVRAHALPAARGGWTGPSTAPAPAPRAFASDEEPLRVRSVAKRHSRGLLAPPAPAPGMTTRVSPPSALALPLAGGTPKPAAALLPASPTTDALAEGQHRSGTPHATRPHRLHV